MKNQSSSTSSSQRDRRTRSDSCNSPCPGQYRLGLRRSEDQDLLEDPINNPPQDGWFLSALIDAITLILLAFVLLVVAVVV